MDLSRIWRLASVYAGGTLASQLLLLASLPLLARLYAPAAFGEYAAVVAVVSVVTMVSALRFDVGLHVPRTTKVAADMRRAAVTTVVGASIGTVCVAAIALSLRDGTSREDVLKWLVLLPGMCCLTGMFNVSSAWAARGARHKYVAIAQIARSAGTVSAQVVAGAYLGWSTSVSLLAGALLGVILGLICLRPTAGAVTGAAFWTRRRWLRSVAVAKMFKEFPGQSTPQALLSSMSNNAATILLVSFTNAHIAGHFALAERAVRAPISLVSASLRQAFVQGLAKAQRANVPVDNIAKSASSKIALVLLIPVICGFIFAPSLIDALMGEQWRESGPVIRWMIPWFFLNALAVPFSASMHVQRQVGSLLILELALLLARAFVIPAAALAGSAQLAVLCAAVLPSLGSLGTILIGRTQSDKRLPR